MAGSALKESLGLIGQGDPKVVTRSKKDWGSFFKTFKIRAAICG